MNMRDTGQTILPLNGGNSLREIDFLDPHTLKISYLLNCVKIVNRLNYAEPKSAQLDYDDIVGMWSKVI